MQCNSINVVEEPVVITRNSHPSEREPARAPQAPNSEPPSAGELGGHRAGGVAAVTRLKLPFAAPASLPCAASLFTRFFLSVCAPYSVFILRSHLSAMWYFVSKEMTTKSPSNSPPRCRSTVGFHLDRCQAAFLSSTCKDQVVPRGNHIWKNSGLLNSCLH